jgi:hypothetical protein
MPRQYTRYCQKRLNSWNRDRSHQGVDYASAQTRVRLYKEEHPAKYTYDDIWHHGLIPGRRYPRGSSAPRLEAEQLRTEFVALAEQWRRETKFSSSVDEKVLHGAYQSIIAMGRSAVPLVLEELEAHRGHWSWALHFMTGVNPVPEGANIDAARDAWLTWGRQQGYLE